MDWITSSLYPDEGFIHQEIPQVTPARVHLHQTHCYVDVNATVPNKFGHPGVEILSNCFYPHTVWATKGQRFYPNIEFTLLAQNFGGPLVLRNY